MNSLVSFILPAYKVAFLQDSINSILSQDYSEIELIILNDASPEPIADLIKSYDDKRIRYYENKVNIGRNDLVGNWNKALNYAEGDFVVLASDDDVYSSNFASEMIKLFMKYPNVNLAHSRVKIIDENNSIRFFSQDISEYETCMDFVYHRLIFNRKQMAPDFMFRRRAIYELGGFVKFPAAWYSDDATWISLSVNGVLYSANTFLNFRMSGKNISSIDKNVVQKINALIMYKKWLKIFLSKYLPFGEKDIFLHSYCLKQIDPILNSHIYMYLPYLKGKMLFRELRHLYVNNMISLKSAIIIVLKNLL